MRRNSAFRSGFGRPAVRLAAGTDEPQPGSPALRGIGGLDQVVVETPRAACGRVFRLSIPRDGDQHHVTPFVPTEKDLLMNDSAPPEALNDPRCSYRPPDFCVTIHALPTYCNCNLLLACSYEDGSDPWIVSRRHNHSTGPSRKLRSHQFDHQTCAA